MSELKHNPLPWTYRWRGDGTMLEDADGMFVAGPIRQDPAHNHLDANAKFLERAVNNFYAMRSMLIACQNRLEEIDDDYISGKLEALIAEVMKP